MVWILCSKTTQDWAAEWPFHSQAASHPRVKLISSIKHHDKSMNAQLFYKHAATHTQVLFQVS